VYQNRFEFAFPRQFYLFNDFFKQPSSWDAEEKVAQLGIPDPEAVIATIGTTAVSPTSYCEAVDGFDSSKPYLAVTKSETEYFSSSLPITQEELTEDVSNGDGSSEGDSSSSSTNALNI